MNSVSHQNIEAKPVTAMVGKAIAARLTQKLQDERAVLALALIAGAPIPPMSRRKASKVMRVSRYKIEVAARATPDELELLALGRLRLRDVRAAHAQPRKPLDDSAIVDFINRVDPNRILAVLDRMTAPQIATAAE